MGEYAERIADGEQARDAIIRFVGPAFDVVRNDYLAKLAEVAAKPLTPDLRAGMEKLALGIKVVDQARAQIEAIVADGKLARAEQRRADAIASLPTERKRWL